MENGSIKTSYRIGIIGAGSIVENSHLPVLKNIKNIQVAWIYDRNFERSVLLSKMFEVSAIAEKDLLEGIKDIDICLLAIPYGVRRKYIEISASLQKMVYVEKPFALTAKEHRDYCSLFPPNKITIGFQRRYYKVVDVLKSVVRSEIFGRLTMIDYKQGYFNLKGGGYLADAKLAGGGIIIESGIHALDQILILTNAESVRCHTVKSLSKKGIDYDTTFDSDLQCGGYLVPMRGEFSSLRNLDNGLILHFDRAVLKCELTPNATIQLVGASGNSFRFQLDQAFATCDRAQSVSESFYLFWTDWLKAIQNSVTNYTAANSSLLTTSWIEQIYKAIQKEDL